MQSNRVDPFSCSIYFHTSFLSFFPNYLNLLLFKEYILWKKYLKFRVKSKLLHVKGKEGRRGELRLLYRPIRAEQLFGERVEACSEQAAKKLSALHFLEQLFCCNFLVETLNRKVAPTFPCRNFLIKSYLILAESCCQWKRATITFQAESSVLLFSGKAP